MTDDQPLPAPAACDVQALATVGDVQALAREMAAAYKRSVAAFRDQLHLSPEEAHARAVEPPQPARRSLISSQPEAARWDELSALTESEPAAAFWQHLKDRARDELMSGQRAATTVGFGAQPWDRACFLAVRTLYLPPGARYFGCRQCHGLVYRSAQTHDKNVARRMQLLVAQPNPTHRRPISS